jgi:class 3 adenylate cyclase
MAEAPAGARAKHFLPKLARRLGLRGEGDGFARESVEAAMLFLDIAGFVKLSSSLEHLDPASELGTGEAARRALNRFLQSVVSTLEGLGADVLKFAGDAVISSFAVTDSSLQPLSSAVLQAVSAGLAVHENFDHFHVGFDGRRLRCKITVTAGTMDVLHVGGFNNRWEFVPAGKPLEETMTYGPITGPNEVLLAPSAARLVEGTVHMTYDDQRGVHLAERLLVPSPPVHDILDGVADQPERMLSYIPHSARPQLSCPSLSNEAHAHGDLAQSEIRLVAVCFVNLLPPARVHSDAGALYQDAHSIVLRLQKIMTRYDGDMRQALLDDKGWTLIFLWGTQGKSHDDDAARSLAAACEMDSAIREYGWVPLIGLHHGEVFCGNIGSLTRCEFSATGPIVNLAARLMTANNGSGGILCSTEVKRATGDQRSFTSVGELRLKGRDQPFPAYRPTLSRVQAGCESWSTSPDRATSTEGQSSGRPSHSEARDSAWDESQTSSASWGPQNQCLERIKARIRSCLRGQKRATVVEVQGEAYSGKTALQMKAFNHAQSEGMLALQCIPSGNLTALVLNDIFYQLCNSLIGRTPTASDATRVLKTLDDELARPDTRVFPPHSMNKMLAGAVGSCSFVDLEPLLVAIAFGKGHSDNGVTAQIPSPARKEVFVEAVLVNMVRMSLQERAAALYVDNADVMDDFLWLLIRNLSLIRSAPLIVVLFVRTEGDGYAPRKEYQRRLDASVNKQLIRRFHLSRLSRPELSSVVLERYSKDGCASVESAIIDFMEERSGGLPPFAAAIADGLVEQNMVHVSGKELRIDRTNLDRHRSSPLFPNSVASMIRRRLDRVGPRAVLVAKVASVLGVHWSAEELCHVLEKRAIPTSDLHASLDVLVDQGILVKLIHPVCMFKSPSFAYVACELLPLSERMVLHGIVAAMLHAKIDAHGTDEPEERDADSARFELHTRLCRHYSQSAQKTSASRAYSAAARLGFKIGEYSQAAHCARSTVSLVNELGEVSDVDDVDIAEQLLIEAESDFRGRPRDTEQALQLATLAVQKAENALLRSSSRTRCSDALRSQRRATHREAAMFLEALIHAAKYAMFCSSFVLSLQIMSHMHRKRWLRVLASDHYALAFDVYVAMRQAVNGWRAAKAIEGSAERGFVLGRSASETAQAFRALVTGMRFAGYPQKMVPMFRTASAHSDGDSTTLSLATFGIAAANVLKSQFIRSDELHREMSLQDSTDQPPDAMLTATMGFVATRVRPIRCVAFRPSAPPARWPLTVHFVACA